MTIRDQVIREIHKLIHQPAHGRARFTVAWSHGQLTAEFAEVQSLACSLWQLDVEADVVAGLDATELESLGQQIAQRVRYLLEPLQVHEVDRDTKAVQLRSSPPQREARTVRYFEVTLQSAAGLRLVRYEKQPSQPRQQISAIVTVELLGAICQDIVDLLDAAA